MSARNATRRIMRLRIMLARCEPSIKKPPGNTGGRSEETQTGIGRREQRRLALIRRNGTIIRGRDDPVASTIPDTGKARIHDEGAAIGGRTSGLSPWREGHVLRAVHHRDRRVGHRQSCANHHDCGQRGRQERQHIYSPSQLKEMLPGQARAA